MTKRGEDECNRPPPPKLSTLAHLHRPPFLPTPPISRNMKGTYRPVNVNGGGAYIHTFFVFIYTFCQITTVHAPEERIWWSMGVQITTRCSAPMYCASLAAGKHCHPAAWCRATFPKIKMRDRMGFLEIPVYDLMLVEVHDPIQHLHNIPDPGR